MSFAVDKSISFIPSMEVIVWTIILSGISIIGEPLVSCSMVNLPLTVKSLTIVL
jgi:hypothetical protein